MVDFRASYLRSIDIYIYICIYIYKYVSKQPLLLPRIPLHLFSFFEVQLQNHKDLSSQNPAYVVYIGEVILPSYIGIILHHYIRIQIKTNQYDGN